jgi:hypothetical protein
MPTVTALPTSTPIVTATPDNQPTDWYAAPWGSYWSGDGTFANPWHLTTAFLNQHREIQAGDTLYLRGGTYRGPFTSYLEGAPGGPVTVRSYPGEWATLTDDIVSSSGVLFLHGHDSVYREFEVASNVGYGRRNGVSAFGQGLSLRDLSVHGAGVALGLWGGPVSVVGLDVYDSATLVYWGSGAASLDENAYAGACGPAEFHYIEDYDFAGWRAATGQDAASTYAGCLP